MIFTEKETKCCPICNNTEFVRDYVREETYCNKCGLVLSSAVQYCGLEKVDNVIPFSAPSEARRGVHIRYSKIKTRHKSYRHNIPNRKLMIKGHKWVFFSAMVCNFYHIFFTISYLFSPLFYVHTIAKKNKGLIIIDWWLEE